MSGSVVPEHLISVGVPSSIGHFIQACAHSLLLSLKKSYIAHESGRYLSNHSQYVGHGNQEVIAAAAKQMSEISYVHTGAYTTGSAEALAHELLDGNPYGLEKAIFVGSGTYLEVFMMNAIP